LAISVRVKGLGWQTSARVATIVVLHTHTHAHRQTDRHTYT